MPRISAAYVCVCDSGLARFLDWESSAVLQVIVTETHTHTRLTALCPELSGSAGTRKVKPTWILLEQETVSSSDSETKDGRGMAFQSYIRLKNP